MEEGHRRGLSKKVCEDWISLVWQVLRLLAIPVVREDTLGPNALDLPVDHHCTKVGDKQNESLLDIRSPRSYNCD